MLVSLSLSYTSLHSPSNIVAVPKYVEGCPSPRALQVITRTSGRCLGVVGDLWVDAVRREVVSLDLEEKRQFGLSATRIANIPLGE